MKICSTWLKLINALGCIGFMSILFSQDHSNTYITTLFLHVSFVISDTIHILHNGACAQQFCHHQGKQHDIGIGALVCMINMMECFTKITQLNFYILFYLQSSLAIHVYQSWYILERAWTIEPCLFISQIGEGTCVVIQYLQTKSTTKYS